MLDLCRRGLNATAVQLGVTLGIVILIWGSIILHLHQGWALTERAAWAEADNLARGFGESIDRTVESVDQVMLTIRALYRRDPAHFDIAALAPRSEMTNDLTLQISITNAAGVMRGSNLDPKAAVDLSDRKHVRVQLETAEDILYISRPVLGRVSRQWSIQLTRKLYDASGRFDGVLVVSLDPTYFAHFYSSLRIGAGAITLVGFDGVIRAHAPASKSAVGSTMPETAMSRIVGGPNNGAFRSISSIDGVDRLNSYCRLDRYSLAVIVGLSADEVFAHYKRDRLQYLVVGATVTVLVLIIGAIIMAQSRSTRAMQRSLQAMLANVSQGILKIDGRRRIRIINQRAIDLLELPPELAKVGAPFDRLLQWQIEHGEFGPSPVDAVDVEALARGGGLGPDVYERTRRNGVVLEVRTQHMAHGGAVRTFTDVTARRENEQALASALNLARTAQSAQSDFLAMMSHEIRTPIAGITGLAGLLLDSELSPTQRRFVSTLREAADSLMHIIDDILDFSKLEAHQMAFEQVPVDLDHLLESVADLMRVKAVEKNLYLRTCVAPDMPAGLIGDPGRVRQILLNLVSNAIKFTEQGGVSVTIGGTVIDPSTAEIVIAVQDTGIGIPVEAQPRLFERFYQVERSRSSEFGGTGLGLAVSARLAERMNGSIAVESVPGEGALFRATLRFRRDALSPPCGTVDQSPLPLPMTQPRTRFRILLAEDNGTNQLVAVTRLEMLGHQVDAVSSGTEAVAALRQTHYDLVLMDVMMPEMDGVEATRAIRAMPAPACDTPIVAMTANVLRRHRDECRAAGMDDFLGKPFLPSQLAQVIERAMAGKLRIGPAAPPLPEDWLARQNLVATMGEAEADAVLEEFAVEAREEIERIGRLAGAGDADALAAACRRLSEAACSVGFNRLGHQAAFTSIDLVDPLALFRTLEETLDRLAAGLVEQTA